MVMAVKALRARNITRLIFSRPAVEAGERLGFLPGDFKEKVDPYLRPLYDALAELIDDTVVERFMDRGTIEVAPLAFMRGRTLSDAFVILDEAQNATREQMKMFLTRLGAGSKMIVNGDVTQIDLPTGVAVRPARRARALRRRRRRRHRRTERNRRRAPPARRQDHHRLPEPGLIYLRNATRKHRLNLRALEKTARALLVAAGEPESTLSLSFVGDTAMRRLNALVA